MLFFGYLVLFFGKLALEFFIMPQYLCLIVFLKNSENLQGNIRSEAHFC